jgi:hypothetical protein
MKKIMLVVLCALTLFFMGTANAFAVERFFDDFNDGNADGWVFPYNSDLSQGPGDWSVENGTLVQRYSGDHNAGLVDNLLISDQVIEAQVRTGGYSGVVLWYQQVNDNVANYVAVSHNFQTAMWVFEVIDGNMYSYPYGGPWIGSDTWFDLKVDADSTTGELAVYLDDVLLFTHLANTTYRTGMSGVYSGNAVGYFDNLRISSLEPPTTIPDVHGTWEFEIRNRDADWDGTQRTVEVVGTAYICQYGYVNASTPNLRIFPVDDITDPLWGFVQERRFAFYKDDFDGGTNLGREITMGIVSRKGNRMSGQTMGFDTNLEWGTSWRGRFHSERIASDTGAFVCPPQP